MTRHRETKRKTCKSETAEHHSKRDYYCASEQWDDHRNHKDIPIGLPVGHAADPQQGYDRPIMGQRIKATCRNGNNAVQQRRIDPLRRRLRHQGWSQHIQRD